MKVLNAVPKTVLKPYTPQPPKGFLHRLKEAFSHSYDGLPRRRIRHMWDNHFRLNRYTWGGRS